jgi:hypothetical protein
VNSNEQSQREFDDWEFERIYSSLFGLTVSDQSSNVARWRYDPFDSKYPTIDGILRRQSSMQADMGDQALCFNEDFVLIQLKGTRFSQGEDSAGKLARRFFAAKDQVNAIAQSGRALLIGLSVDIAPQPPALESIYIGAPDAALSAAGITAQTRIEPGRLTRTIAAILDAVQPLSTERQVIFPRPQEIVYFNKRPDGTFSVAENGIIVGRDISINWTVPRPINRVLLSTISGSPEIEAVPVGLPHPPYNAIPSTVVSLTSGEWQVPQQLPGINDFWWVLQIRFNNGEATVKVEARI